MTGGSGGPGGQDEQVTWGPVFDDDTVRINFPAPSTDWVEVKRYLTEEDDAIASDAAMQDGLQMTALSREQRRKLSRESKSNPDTMKMFFRQGTYRLMLLKRVVKAWSFLDKQHRPIPCTPENIIRLPSHTRDWIMERVDEMNPKLEEESPKEGEPNEEDHPLDGGIGGF